MHFPVYIHLGTLSIHPHLFFEGLAYLTGFLCFFLNPQKKPRPYTAHQRLWVIAGALMGAALGSKILFWFCDPPTSLAHWNDLAYLQGGKTIVGGLIGGLIGVETAKKRLGTTASTGDRFVPSILLGIAIGRLGCFFTGLADDTYGNYTTLPWGVDFGDGPRHPTQLYEILWIGILAMVIWRRSLRPYLSGDLFKLFMVGYLGFRFWIEFLKPGYFIVGLTAIQWACLFTLLYYAQYFKRLWKYQEVTA